MSEIVQADIIEWCKGYHGPKFHALLCDPPYELGFMGKDWDRSGIAFNPATWEALAEHLLPGAFGMAFASARGYPRVMVAIEDAGLRLHPSIFGYKLLGWNYGSGFPKATRVGKNGDHPEFAGHRYGLQALKPALEPIIIFQVPYEGKPVESIVETGAGALNIDGARIRMSDTDQETLEAKASQKNHGVNFDVGLGAKKGTATKGNSQGRWPANFYVDEEAARRLGEQSGESTSNIRPPTPDKENDARGTWQMSQHRDAVVRGVNDKGTAARFFFNVNRQLDEADPVMYQAKASRKERDAGLEGMEESSPFERGSVSRHFEKMGGKSQPRRNAHPTVKPIDLTRWLATLLLPPEEYAPRRILVPFAGSGSEMIGAALAGWEEIIGIEREAEYVEIVEARTKWWCEKRAQCRID